MVYHTGLNPISRDWQVFAGLYMVEHMCQGAWFYIVDDFGNAVEYVGAYK